MKTQVECLPCLGRNAVDVAKRMTQSPAMQEKMSGIVLGGPVNEEQLKPILSDAAIFGVDLYECGLAEKVIGYFKELIAGPGAVRATLKKYI